MCTVIVLCIADALLFSCRNFDALMDRFTHHLVKTSPAAESGSYSGISADKVSCASSCLDMLLCCVNIVCDGKNHHKLTSYREV